MATLDVTNEKAAPTAIDYENKTKTRTNKETDHVLKSMKIKWHQENVIQPCLETQLTVEDIGVQGLTVATSTDSEECSRVMRGKVAQVMKLFEEMSTCDDVEWNDINERADAATGGRTATLEMPDRTLFKTICLDY